MITKARLKGQLIISRFIKTLSHRKVMISNPGAIIAAPFLDQFGVVEALHTGVDITLEKSDFIGRATGSTPAA